MNREWDYLRSLQARFPALGKMMFRFNFHPAAYLHHNKRSDIFPALPACVWSVGRVHGRLSECMLREHDLLNNPVFSFPHWGWPLVLLSSDRIERLAVHLGAVIHGVRIRGSLSRDHVLSWKEKLGTEAYQFAMTRASLIPPPRDLGIDMLGLEPRQCGFDLINCAVLDMPDPMRIRFDWKLPMSYAILECDPAQARKLVRLVLSIVETEWHSSSLSLAQ